MNLSESSWFFDFTSFCTRLSQTHCLTRVISSYPTPNSSTSGGFFLRPTPTSQQDSLKLVDPPREPDSRLSSSALQVEHCTSVDVGGEQRIGRTLSPNSKATNKKTPLTIKGKNKKILELSYFSILICNKDKTLTSPTNIFLERLLDSRYSQGKRLAASRRVKPQHCW